VQRRFQKIGVEPNTSIRVATKVMEHMANRFEVNTSRTANSFDKFLHSKLDSVDDV
jgi:hypothetical protein